MFEAIDVLLVLKYSGSTLITSTICPINIHKKEILTTCRTSGLDRVIVTSSENLNDRIIFVGKLHLNIMGEIAHHCGAPMFKVKEAEGRPLPLTT